MADRLNQLDILTEIRRSGKPVAPVDILMRPKYHKPEDGDLPKKMRSIFRRLEARGMLEETGDGHNYRLTPAGTSAVEKAMSETEQVNRAHAALAEFAADAGRFRGFAKGGSKVAMAPTADGYDPGDDPLELLLTRTRRNTVRKRR